MHDLVRDMAIKITGPQFMVKAGMQLEDIPEEQEWSKHVERVSLMVNEIKEIASSTSPMCPKLLTFFLCDNPPLKSIENSFFEHMPVLQVLNYCWALKHMPSLAELSSLQRLDLKKSGIREIPHGLDMLVKLTYLDLSETRKLKFFPSGILPKLSQLEYLRFDVEYYPSSFQVKIKGEELKGLERLSTFQGFLIFYDKVNGFKEYFMSRMKYVGTSCSYEFSLEDENIYVGKSNNRWCNLNEVRLKKWSMSTRREADGNVNFLEALLKDVQSLKIERCKVGRSLNDVWWVDIATRNLKRCRISRCEGIECVGLFSFSSPLFFQTLEILRVEFLENLRILFKMEGEGGGLILPPSLPLAVFSCLKSMNISYCINLKKLFQPGFLPYLQNLEQIHVRWCDGLEEIIESTTTKEQEEEEEEEESMNSSKNNNKSYRSYSAVRYSLPNLKSLSLKGLPILKSICEGKLACDVLEEIRVRDCPLLQRIPLSKPPSSLQSIYVHKENGEEWWKSVEYDDPDAKDLFQPYLKFTRS